MPLYEYECTQCGQVEEALQKFSDKPLSKCRHCSGKLKKLISNTSFHLKGNGWYVTDYAQKTSNEAPSKAAEKSKPKSAEAKTSSSNSTSGNSAE